MHNDNSGDRHNTHGDRSMHKDNSGARINRIDKRATDGPKVGSAVTGKNDAQHVRGK